MISDSESKVSSHGEHEMGESESELAVDIAHTDVASDYHDDCECVSVTLPDFSESNSTDIGEEPPYIEVCELLELTDTDDDCEYMWKVAQLNDSGHGRNKSRADPIPLMDLSSTVGMQPETPPVGGFPCNPFVAFV